MEPNTGPPPPARGLYLLCGLAFSGKTTLTAALSRHLGAAVVSLDAINASRGLQGGMGIPVEPVLLDLVEKFEFPTADENVLIFPFDAVPEAWVARYL